MTCRKAQRFMPYINGSSLIATFSVVLLTTGFSLAQYQQSTQLRWTSPEMPGQPSQQTTVMTPAQQYPTPQSPIRLVQHVEPVQSQQSPQDYRIAQLPGTSDAMRDTMYSEHSRTGSVGQTPNQPPLSAPIPVPTRPLSDSGTGPDFSRSSSTTTNGLEGMDDPCIDPRDPSLFQPMHELTVGLGFEMDLSELNMCTINYGPYEPRNWPCTCFQWVAPSTCMKAAYFEDPLLERYGHSWGPFLQPVVSGGKFYLSVLFLPYKMGVTPPQECVYDVGYYRPGSCAPYMLDPLPISVRGALFQAGATVGLAYAIP